MSSPTAITSSTTATTTTVSSATTSSSDAPTTTPENAAAIVQKIAQDLLELQKTYASSFRKCNSNLMHKRFSKRSNQYKLEMSLSSNSASPTKPNFSPSSSSTPTSAKSSSSPSKPKTSIVNAAAPSFSPPASATVTAAYTEEKKSPKPATPPTPPTLPPTSSASNAFNVYFSPIEEAILRAKSFPTLIRETAQVSVFGEKGKLILLK
jgi:hypothetical protein